jgi:hypothetical protein
MSFLPASARSPADLRGVAKARRRRDARLQRGEDPCGSKCHQTFSVHERHDPYCIIDPACISPFYSSTWDQVGTDPQFMPHWQGLEWLGEAGTYGTGLHMLAIPNYMLFMLSLCVIVLIIKRVARPSLRRFLLAAVTTWCIVEYCDGLPLSLASIRPYRFLTENS